jgi:hypothetical protein
MQKVVGAIFTNNEAEFSTPVLDCAFNLWGHKPSVLL